MNFTSLTFWNLRFPINRIATILCIVKCFYKDSLYRKKCMMLSKCLRNRDLFPLTLIYLLFILSFPLPVSVSFSLIVLVSLLHLISIILLPTTFKSIYLAKFAKQNDTGRLSVTILYIVNCLSYHSSLVTPGSVLFCVLTKEESNSSCG